MVDMPKPQVKPNEVLIKVKMVGICGTDVSVYRGDYTCKDNVILGHEFCGEIAEVGSDVFTCKVGDFVASAASSGCGKCDYCLAGKPSYCREPQSLARMIDGALAEFIAVDQHMIYHLMPETTLVEGQGVVGVATALHAVQRSGIKFGDNVVIVGPGYSGLQILQLCKMMGATVTYVGTRDERLEKAALLGADKTVNIRKSDELEKASEIADVCFECAGTLSSLQMCLRLSKKGATTVIFGTSKDTITDVPQKDFYYKEISLVGSKGGYGCYEQAIELLGNHRIKIEPLVTHVFPFEETPKAFEMMDKRLDNVIRAAVKF